MPVAQIRNADKQLLSNADLSRALDRNVVCEFIDETGGQTIDTSNVVINLGTTAISTAQNLFSISSNIITIANPGIFQFFFQVGVEHSNSSGQDTLNCWLDCDPATGSFSTIVGSYTGAAILKHGKSVASSLCIVRSKAGYRYRMVAIKGDGSHPLITFANGSKLSIVRLYGTQ